MDGPTIPFDRVPKRFLQINLIVAAIYLAWWLVPGRAGNPILFGLLFIGEIYHIIMTLIFWETVWPADTDPKELNFLPDIKDFSPRVDVFIPTAGEPAEVVRATAVAAKNMAYPNFQIHILNDGYVAKKPNWQEIEELARELKIDCITRKVPGGAKAGNINHALAQTSGEIVVIFDADMVPHPDFLVKTIPYFVNQKVGFVQTPQYYRNANVNNVTAGAWEQEAFFYGAIMRGKEKDNAAFICGTNVAIRRKALDEIGGFVADNIVEDLATSIKIHQQGYTSFYVPEVLSEGLAPEDFGSYFKQQLRWASGNLQAFFHQNAFLQKNLTFRQRVQYVNNALFYFSGIVIFIDMVMPLIFLFSGIQPVTAATTSFAIFFIPFMFLNIYTLYLASNAELTFRAISFNQAGWTIQLLALGTALTGRNLGFVVTPKTAQKKNYFSLVLPHIIYIFLFAVSVVIAIVREGLDPAVATNIAWGIFNTVMFLPFIKAAIDG